MINYQNKYYSGNVIVNSLQTNGTLLDEIFITFFKEHGFKISISYDGSSNDMLRHQTAETLKGMHACRYFGLPFNTITTIHSGNYLSQIALYNEFKADCRHVKFNHIFESGAAIENSEFILDLDRYIASVKEFFDYWLADPEPINVTLFYQYLKMLFSVPGGECIYGGCLYGWLGVDSNGDVYPCGRDYPSQYLMPNIVRVSSLEDIFTSISYVELLRSNLIRKIKCRDSCALFYLCGGGCNNSAIINGDIESSGFDNCRIILEMLPHVHKRILEMRGEIANHIVRDFVAEHGPCPATLWKFDI